MSVMCVNYVAHTKAKGHLPVDVHIYILQFAVCMRLCAKRTKDETLRAVKFTNLRYIIIQHPMRHIIRFALDVYVCV